MALIALASRGGHQQKALFGDSFCIIFTLFMGRRMTNQSGCDYVGYEDEKRSLI